MTFQYEEDNSVKLKTDVEMEFVFSYLENMNPRNKSFCTLSNGDGSYVQCAGAKLRLIVEFRKCGKSGFSHYILSKKQQDDSRENSINYSGGIIRLKYNEILSVNDAKRIFQTFYSQNKIPQGYNLRNITNAFKK